MLKLLFNRRIAFDDSQLNNDRLIFSVPVWTMDRSILNSDVMFFFFCIPLVQAGQKFSAVHTTEFAPWLNLEKIGLYEAAKYSFTSNPTFVKRLERAVSPVWKQVTITNIELRYTEHSRLQLPSAYIYWISKSVIEYNLGSHKEVKIHRPVAALYSLYAVHLWLSHEHFHNGHWGRHLNLKRESCLINQAKRGVGSTGLNCSASGRPAPYKRNVSKK